MSQPEQVIQWMSPGETEVARQLQICNACRYCEGFCAVFPAMTRRLDFAAADVHYLANLCHHCGACLHACQYAPPHEFAVNLPRAMAQVRRKTYAGHAWPAALGALYERNGLTVGLALVGVAHQLPLGSAMPLVWATGTLVQAGLAIASLFVVVRSWKDDLVESRRRVRGPGSAWNSAWAAGSRSCQPWAASTAWSRRWLHPSSTTCSIWIAWASASARRRVTRKAVPAARPSCRWTSPRRRARSR